ncbi:MAG: 2-succinyl-5-enolpyruvyl-6-hydroxy-3-cyclohexene-carboxylate synthase [Subtercola sp.]|nr:2-succinyl-5-enolpyruvyl-6-hydroxy-3-cyclohexene-carboxylate synthase [Subtercola sp.]
MTAVESAHESPAAAFSLAILSEFARLGTTDAIVAPGSRSQALALVLAEFDRARILDLQVRLDERSAGFTALGLGVETARPALVVTTSGTAVANLLPAVLEASHSNVPIILITSDRPDELRGTGSNQTTWQPGIFGRFVRAEFDVAAPVGEPSEPELARDIARRAWAVALGEPAAADARSASRAPGPVHVNLQLREPLSGVVPDLTGLGLDGLDQVGPDRVWPDRVKPDQVGSDRVKLDRVELGLDGPDQVEPDQAWPDRVGSDQVLPDRVGADRVGPDRVGPGGAVAGDAATVAADVRVDFTSAAAADTRAGSAGTAAVRAPGAPRGADAAPLELARGPRTIVIAGHGSGPAPEQLAHAGGWPLIAEVSSGSRFGRHLVVAYRELLADPEFGGRVERAIVFGHPSLSREVPALLLRDDVEVVVVGHAADDLGVFNPGHRVSRFAERVTVAPAAAHATAAHATAAETVAEEGTAGAPADTEVGPESLAADRAWLREWVLASRALLEGEPDDVAPPNIHAARSADIAERREYRVNELAALRAPITRRMLGLAVWRATWPHDRLVLGASRLIRDLDRWAPGKKIGVHSNRGLAGIDGTIATATGIALASQRAPGSLRGGGGGSDVGSSAGGVALAGRESSARAEPRSSALAAQTGVTRVLIGDLTLLHDVGSLLFGVGEARPRIQLVVGNDGGGTIFDTLEVAATADRAAFDRVMNTPQNVDLAALAAAYGWAYSRATTRSELDSALTAPVTGPSLLEVPLLR